MVLLVGAGLLGKSFYRLLHVETGFDVTHLATVQVMAPDNSMRRMSSRWRCIREINRRLGKPAGRAVGGNY